MLLFLHFRLGSNATDPPSSAGDPMSAVRRKRPDRNRSSEMTLRAMCGRLRVGKRNLHFAAMVGAAMCSAFLRGTHDRWP